MGNNFEVKCMMGRYLKYVRKVSYTGLVSLTH